LKFLRGYIAFADRLNERVGQGVAWLSTLLVLLICFDVVKRYLLNTTSVMMIELEWYLFSLIFLLGAGFTLRHDRHVRVDVLYGRLSVTGKAWVNLLGSLLFLIPFCSVMIYSSLPYVRNSFLLREISPDPGGLPARYLIKAAIPLGFFLLLLQAFSLAFSSLLVIVEKERKEQGGGNRE
jgi:TRAP-type mannitol/chloroaromatic compound transport system permease small subunit